MATYFFWTKIPFCNVLDHGLSDAKEIFQIGPVVLSGWRRQTDKQTNKQTDSSQISQHVKNNAHSLASLGRSANDIEVGAGQGFQMRIEPGMTACKAQRSDNEYKCYNNTTSTKTLRSSAGGQR